jgi:hypothetical protein
MKVINKFENKLTHLKGFLKGAVYNSLVLFSPFKTHKSITKSTIKIIFANKHDPIFSSIIQVSQLRLSSLITQLFSSGFL